ncbi:ExbD/TolR family protein [Cetobacterium sp.]
MKRRTKRRNLATPDLTPLIDVVFLLLIFFMLVTTFDRYSGFKLELPKGDMISETSKAMYELVIDKDENHFLLVDKVSNPITLETIGEKVLNVEKITISADKNLKYEAVVKAISTLKNNGVDKVELNFYE